MTAHEVQIQRLIAFVDAGRVSGQRDLLVNRNQTDDKLLAQPSCRIGTDLIGETARGNGDQPRSRIVRRSLLRPLCGGGHQRFLHRVLAAAEVAVATKQHAQDLRRQIAQQVLSVAVQSKDHRFQSGGGPLIT
jgi:hypothetical protein